MGDNPSYFSACGDDCPVENVSWHAIQEFIQELNSRQEGTYRLPTEAQWEYAARSGSRTAFANGDISVTDCQFDENLNAMGWYCGNAKVAYPGCID
ncbi:MAG: SUMF1/EgtB/PvdO family nonheme iron enzyme, partial [Desulfatitalea sp.]|nr:SUMF1/EgtB/PvdO family nonheme iron enzyme [Desulfatitalea sp.]NNK00919.1 SUMF1/EgtB/PvdO family nonheme iron enzyme [Desulfatitalea sp.]